MIYVFEFKLIKKWIFILIKSIKVKKKKVSQIK